MTSLHNFAVAFASIPVVAIIASTTPANAFQLFTDRDEWKAALSTPTETLDFGESRSFSDTTIFSNDVSVTPNLFNGVGTSSGSTIGAFFAGGGGSVRGNITVNLPNNVNALGFDVSVGPVNLILYASFITEEGFLREPGLLRSSAFTGIISEPDDPSIAGFFISSNSAGTGFFNASNISIPVAVSVPETSPILGLFIMAGTFFNSFFFKTIKRDR